MLCRSKVIKLIENQSKDLHEIDGIKDLIVSYSIAHGKDERLALDFFRSILGMQYLLENSIKTALDYYAVKHEIVILLNNKNNIIKII